MHTPTAIALLTVTVSTGLAAAPLQYQISPLPPNTLLNNHGLAPVPPQFLAPGVYAKAVNDHDEFVIQYGSSGSHVAYHTVFLPTAAHGLPAGPTFVIIPAEQGRINNLGQVTGTSGDASAYLWLPQADYGLSKGVNYVGPFPAGIYGAFGNDINDHGMVVGHAGPLDSQGGFAPYVFFAEPAFGRAAGLHYPLGLGPTPGTATAVNNRGWVAGNTGSIGLGATPFVWLPQDDAGLAAGTHYLIPDTNLPHSATVTDINDANQVVGSFISRTQSGSFVEQFAFLWQPDLGLVNLNSLISPTSGWHLSYATGINNRGDIIGEGRYNGQFARFYLTVPEPSYIATTALASLTTIAPRHRQRRRR